MNELFLGVDPSLSGTGLVILDTEGRVTQQKEISTKKTNSRYDIEERIINIGNDVIEFVHRIIPLIQVCYIEDISFGSSGESSVQLASLNYYIRIQLLNTHIPFYTISPSQLKKYISGNGQAKKELMLKEVYKRWGVDYNSNNLADAYSLARYALDNYKKGIFELHKKIKEKKKKKYDIIK